MGQRRRAFTLIEMLIVIAILAVLAAMLLPAATRARRSAGLVQCTANLRELGQAMLMYATKHDGCVIIGFPGDSQPFHNNWYYDSSWNRYIHLGMLTHDNVLAPRYLVNQKKADGSNTGGKINVGFAPKRFFCPLETHKSRLFANNTNPSPVWTANYTCNPWPPIQGNYTQLGYGTRPSMEINLGDNPIGVNWNVPVTGSAATQTPIPWPRLMRMNPRNAWAADYLPSGAGVGLRTSHPEVINVLFFDLSVRRINVAGPVKAAINLGDISTGSSGVWPQLDKQ